MTMANKRRSTGWTPELREIYFSKSSARQSYQSKVEPRRLTEALILNGENPRYQPRAKGTTFFDVLQSEPLSIDENIKLVDVMEGNSSWETQLRAALLVLELLGKYDAPPSNRVLWWLNLFRIPVEKYKATVAFPVTAPMFYAVHLERNVYKTGREDRCFTNPFYMIFYILFLTKEGWRYMGKYLLRVLVILLCVVSIYHFYDHILGNSIVFMYSSTD